MAYAYVSDMEWEQFMSDSNDNDAESYSQRIDGKTKKKFAAGANSKNSNEI